MADGIRIDAEGLADMEARLRKASVELGQKVEADALKDLAAEALHIVRRLGPRSTRHRGPGQRGRDKWRSPMVHAIDTIRVGSVQKASDGGRYIAVGPQRGDNSPSFYLKFLEYGWTSSPRAPAGTHRTGAQVTARPFLRPAQA